MNFLNERLAKCAHWLEHRRQQHRLEIIQAELLNAQADCAALGAYIGRLIQRKTELETELNREESGA